MKKTKNSKLEFRNPKQIQIPKSKSQNPLFVFGISRFEFRYCPVFQYPRFEF